jgi:tRNA nucleotidyltransferase/poly(A) polymerase
MPKADQIRRAIVLLEDVCARNGIRDAFHVGGFPRSIAMGFGYDDVSDLDIASGTPEKATQLAGLVAAEGKADYYEVLHRTRTVRLEVGGVEMDFQGPAAHERVLPLLHMWGVEATPIARNIFDRDFTINSLAIPIGGNRVVDLTKRGMDDIDDKRIASILPPEDAVPANPLMITRAVRFAYKFDYVIDGALWHAMKANVDKLKEGVSPERLAIEAYVLSKHDVGDMLDELGLEYMHGPNLVEVGKEIAKEKRGES